MHLNKLEEGDIVDVVAPSYGFAPELIIEMEEVIAALGYQARIPEEIVNPHNDPFSANSRDIRFLQLKNALYASDSKLIWAAKGGYGAAELIPLLDQLPPPLTYKIFIGFSDLTSIHLFLQQKWGWPTIHAKVLLQFCPGYMEQKSDSIDPSFAEIKALLTGAKPELQFELSSLNDTAKQNLTIEGQIIGGNLCLLQTSIGTVWQLNAQGKIIFVEDVDERGYSVDRMLRHLTQAKVLDGAVAIIFGDFTGGFEKNGSNLVKDALTRFAESVSIPVLSLSGIGHDVVNHPLPFGTKSILHLGEQAILICEAIK